MGGFEFAFKWSVYVIPFTVNAYLANGLTAQDFDVVISNIPYAFAKVTILRQIDDNKLLKKRALR